MWRFPLKASLYACIHDWLNEWKRKNSKLIRSGFYVFSRRGEFLNCLQCSALALLLHSTIMCPIQKPCAEKGFAEFLIQKRWHTSVILGAKSGERGKAVSVALGVEKAETCLRTWWATGCSFSTTIGSGASLPLNLLSCLKRREIRKEGKQKKKWKKQMCGSKRVALNPTHFKPPLDSVN